MSKFVIRNDVCINISTKSMPLFVAVFKKQAGIIGLLLVYSTDLK
jgi:hypothetical protein